MPSVDIQKRENQRPDTTVHSAGFLTLGYLLQTLHIYCQILDCMLVIDKNYLRREVVFVEPTLLAVSPGTSQFREAEATANS